ncbi:uncharacterized protein LOC143297457 [Babylonia areolata]|uniref:uncharacterized protein LOC143297457 n=1 Tax=Babylonia areolata TaxID=304850 RepID=UPI003FD6BEBE
MTPSKLIFTSALALLVLGSAHAFLRGSHIRCQQGVNCHLPDCFCPTLQHPDIYAKEIPQMVYFGFDDALTGQVDQFYRQLFTEYRRNPNGCPITMSLYVQDQWTNYNLVNEHYKRGNEIGSHSITHTNVDTREKLLYEAGGQKENLEKRGKLPAGEVVGWRSPNLKPAGDAQPEVLQYLSYTYDITHTYTTHSVQNLVAWPFTLDYGYPYSCAVEPCPGRDSSHPGFWEIPINLLYDPKSGYPCVYVDACRPTGEEAAFEFLKYNFDRVYNTNRAPFGLHMHAAWFFTTSYLNAMHRFLDYILQKDDVYVISAKRVLDWMRAPVKLSQIKTMAPTSWSCENPLPRYTTTTPKQPHTTTPKPHTTTPKPHTTPKQPHTTPPKPHTTTPKPHTTTPKPHTTPKQPHTTTPKPHTTPKQPHTTTPKPHTTPKQPHTTTPKPHTTPKQPHTTTPKPHTTPKQPHTTTPKPHTTPKQPHTTTPKPHTTPKQPHTTTPKPHTTPVTTTAPQVPDTCVQGTKCKLPFCQCRSLVPPGGLSVAKTPQIVYVTIIGGIDDVNFSPIRDLFKTLPTNPNSCPISATLFVPLNGNNPTYVTRLRDDGHEIAMYGNGHSSVASQFTQELASFRQLKSSFQTANPEAGGIFQGYRYHTLTAMGEPLYKVLHAASDVTYDSSLTKSHGSLQDVLPYPYTLDYGWQEECTHNGDCPTGRYTGLWEIPFIPLIDHKKQFPCRFADACFNQPRTVDETFQLFSQNFDNFVNTNRAPMGIHLRKEWFSHSVYQPNLLGLRKFLESLLSRKDKDVYVVSVEKMLEWLRNPTSLDRIESFEPFGCYV